MAIVIETWCVNQENAWYERVLRNSIRSWQRPLASFRKRFGEKTVHKRGLADLKIPDDRKADCIGGTWHGHTSTVMTDFSKTSISARSGAMHSSRSFLFSSAIRCNSASDFR